MTGEGVLAALAALWARIVATSPAPGPLDAVLVPAVVTALLLSPAWPHLKHGVTIVHEAGHGAAATATRRRLRGIRLHSDTSGLTVSVGPPRGPGMVLTLLAGYPAPSAAGLLVAWAVAAGHSSAALWGCLVLLAAVLVQIRNWFGLWSVLVAGAVVGPVTWFADPAWRTRAALAVAALLLVGGLRAALELPRAHRRERGSDADQLARLTAVPAAVWLALFIVLAAGCVAAAAALLTPVR
ncbi:M50 family metallopeptidase [Amnibacterium endophyticum]|uniref:M50 family metallopeptidase n=1 Tax=Amnibacterium endophyticum TaxID=2109337 RepID=A0ABW4LHI8_9MICO